MSWKLLLDLHLGKFRLQNILYVFNLSHLLNIFKFTLFLVNWINEINALLQIVLLSDQIFLGGWGCSGRPWIYDLSISAILPTALLFRNNLLQASTLHVNKLLYVHWVKGERWRKHVCYVSIQRHATMFSVHPINCIHALYAQMLFMCVSRMHVE